jgi:hypothetical protein
MLTHALALSFIDLSGIAISLNKLFISISNSGILIFFLEVNIAATSTLNPPGTRAQVK